MAVAHSSLGSQDIPSIITLGGPEALVYINRLSTINGLDWTGKEWTGLEWTEVNHKSCTQIYLESRLNAV